MPAGSDAPDFSASYHVDEAFPAFTATTPVGALPYGLALAISSSAFNQLLKAETESGLMRASLTEIDFGFGPVPLTAGNLLPFIPALSIIDPATDLRIDLAPTLAPVVSGGNGPEGELGDLRIGHLKVTLVVANSGSPLLTIAVDVRIGLDLVFADGQLAFLLGSLSSEGIGLTITSNQISANETQLTNVLLFLLPDVLPTLADSLGAFPIPSFLGFDLGLVEVSKSGQFMSLFADLVPASP